MANSLALIIMLELLFNNLFIKIKIPSLLGMILVEALIGPYRFNLLGREILEASSAFREIALIIILLRVGFGKEKNIPTLILS